MERMMAAWDGKHTEGCAQLEIVPCPAGKSLHGEAADEHWWSGWPGAYCMKCGAEDKDEVCLATACSCPCHDEFWAGYEAAMKNKKPISTEDWPL